MPSHEDNKRYLKRSFFPFKQKQGVTNDEGYSGFFERNENQLYFKDIRRIKGFVVKPDYTDKLKVYCINDYLITDLELYTALCKMYPTATDHEIYFLYLDSKYPVYSYH